METPERIWIDPMAEEYENPVCTTKPANEFGHEPDEYVLSPQWRDIDSAPKDGTAFIGYRPVPNTELWLIAVTYLVEDEFRMVELNEGNFENLFAPTHWTPLPTPPNQRKDDG